MRFVRWQGAGRLLRPALAVPHAHAHVDRQPRREMEELAVVEMSGWTAGSRPRGDAVPTGDHIVDSVAYVREDGLGPATCFFLSSRTLDVDKKGELDCPQRFYMHRFVKS